MVYIWLKKHKIMVIVAIIALGLGLIWVKTRMWKDLSGIFNSVKDRFTEEKKLPDSVEALMGERVIPVNVFKVSEAHFKDSILTSGSVKGGAQIDLRFEKEGKVSEFRFKEGEIVKKGDVIARLDPKDTYLKLRQAQIQLNQYQKLYEIGAIIKAKLEEAQINYEMARADYNKTFLKAPRDGLLGEKNTEPGEFVTPQAKVATLIDIEDVFVEGGIIEKDIDKIRKKQKVLVSVQTYQGIDFMGEVEGISPYLDLKTRTQTVKIKLENPRGSLLPGMFARVKIVVFEKSNALVVPLMSLKVVTQGGAKYFQVFVIDEENFAHSRWVETGYSSFDYVEITGGLNPEDIVVKQIPEELKDGAKVEIVAVTEYREE